MRRVSARSAGRSQAGIPISSGALSLRSSRQLGWQSPSPVRGGWPFIGEGALRSLTPLLDLEVINPGEALAAIDQHLDELFTS
ncbi:hypothetical protein ACFXNW_19135 [Nocardia sp. NPDC059180]|uniref:hypothetical protein n=1 Tax=Nocardia sp. NPDC059180 TaxID=3346761 RepID=UPI00367A9E34